MPSHHAHLKVRFYPGHEGLAWTCVVQRVGPYGMQQGEDLLSATGRTKDEARANALALAKDDDLREAITAAH